MTRAYELDGGDLVHPQCYIDEIGNSKSPVRKRPIKKVRPIWPSMGRCVLCGGTLPSPSAK